MTKPLYHKIGDYRQKWTDHMNRMNPKRYPSLVRDYTEKGQRDVGRLGSIGLTLCEAGTGNCPILEVVVEMMMMMMMMMIMIIIYTQDGNIDFAIHGVIYVHEVYVYIAAHETRNSNTSLALMLTLTRHERPFLGCLWTFLDNNMVVEDLFRYNKKKNKLDFSTNVDSLSFNPSTQILPSGILSGSSRDLGRRSRPQQWKDKTIHRWYTQFKETSCLCKKKSTGRLSTSPGDEERVRQLYQRSPQKSTHRASRELSMSQPTVWRVICKRLRFKPYRLQLLQALGPADYINRAEFCIDFQNKLEADNDNFAARLVFSVECTFHLNGKVVNRHNVEVWEELEYRIDVCRVTRGGHIEHL
ncbi:hypothetical protein C0J52_05998 [Blattella germanica]|nr:hypothetical protein C0J52_05998 [Blattella germanica]